MKPHFYFKRSFLVFFCIFLLSLQSVLSVTYYICDDEDWNDNTSRNVCGFSLLSAERQIIPFFDFTSVSDACKSKLVIFSIEGQCSEFKSNSAVCPPHPDLDCFNTIGENKVCAYMSTSSSCIESPCRQTMYNYCSACLHNYLLYTQGPCE